jgi:hypothetical protein
MRMGRTNINDMGGASIRIVALHMMFVISRSPVRSCLTLPDAVHIISRRDKWQRTDK